MTQLHPCLEFLRLSGPRQDNPHEIAKASDLTREALYKALRQDAQPRFDTISRVCTAPGMRRVVRPVQARRMRELAAYHYHMNNAGD